jgi:hypothetical protein
VFLNVAHQCSTCFSLSVRLVRLKRRQSMQDGWYLGLRKVNVPSLDDKLKHVAHQCPTCFSTKLIWNVGATGFGGSIFGKPFAAIYKRNLKRAIPNLIAEMSGAKPGALRKS